ncbi:TBCC-domain-containing protein [Mytilinidion resinicola]|uniref:TBCC-domain-containing protein n=1 Tax=Mytilinidion resinicola TaxID=574789 RepID=A0A6A6Z1D7_9PEZI|nr:TBCC-domain-containing protein [Mytilinidion resinicola]KAF2814047.1 TBCC-domain-containing protein [Mytilinidion resinicola]
MGSQPQSEAGLKERFFRYFQHEVTALQEQMERLSSTALAGGERNDAVDHCLAGIARLSHEVKDASSYIPAYDQRTYAEAIKALNDKLQKTRLAFAPRSKFSFRTAHKNPSAISLSSAAELAAQKTLRVSGYPSSPSSTNPSSFAPTPLDAASPVDEKPESSLYSNHATNAEGEATKAPTTVIAISNHAHAHIVLPHSTSHTTTRGTVSNLRRCVADMSTPTSSATGHPFAGLTLKNIKHSLIVCGQVAGATHVTGVENSVVVAATRQFRMHGSKNVDVYLHSASRPIVEECEGVRFAPLPTSYVTDANAESANQWDQIDDFDWLQAEQSPHWSILPLEKRVEERVWKEVVPGGHNISLEDILKAVGV